MPAGRWATNGAVSGVGSPPMVFVFVRVKAIAPLPPSLPLIDGLIESWVAARAEAGAARAAHRAMAPTRNPLRMGVAPLAWMAGATSSGRRARRGRPRGGQETRMPVYRPAAP